MGETAVERGVGLICRYRLAGRTPGRAREHWLRFHFEFASRPCRALYGDICARCPDCACAERALEEAELDSHAAMPRGKIRSGESRPGVMR